MIVSDKVETFKFTTVLIFYKQPLLIIFLLFSSDDLNVFSVISAPLFFVR